MAANSPLLHLLFEAFVGLVLVAQCVADRLSNRLNYWPRAHLTIKRDKDPLVSLKFSIIKWIRFVSYDRTQVNLHFQLTSEQGNVENLGIENMVPIAILDIFLESIQN